MNDPGGGTVLLVDDDQNSVRVLSALLGEFRYGIASAGDVDQALRILKNADPDAIITDIMLPGRDGLYLLEYCREHYPEIPVILLTAYGSVEAAVSALRNGAFYYFMKPPDYNQLRNILALAVEQRRLKREIERLRNDKAAGRSGVRINHSSPSMQKICETINAIKDSQSSALVSGETGSGKELIARALHYWGIRAKAPFVAVNCAAVPRNLIESELFGYEKGAFTGATGRQLGKFIEAHGGTLFLDEVGDLDLSVQAKLLRVLQNREVQPLGGGRSVQVDFRLVCATNRDLSKDVENGVFREDIYYRINVVQIHVPPLRQRKGDIPLLAGDFLREFCARENRVLTFSAEVLDFFQRFDWPGNVRQLRNIIERAVVISRGPVISLRDMPAELSGAVPQDSVLPRRTLLLRDLEHEAIVEALERAGGNKSQAARLLGISRKALYKKIDDYGIHEA